MSFQSLCDFLDTIKQTQVLHEKHKLIRDRLKEMRESAQQEGTSIFPTLRLLVPGLDRERDSYNMKEAKVARTLIKMLGLPPGNDKNVLSKSYLMSAQATDFGDVVYSVIRKYLSNYKTTLTIQECNSFLDDLTKKRSDSDIEEILFKMFRKLSPESIRWVIRIILKDLKLGVSSNTILNCYHKDGASYYATNNNLKKVCKVLADQNVKLHELEIEIFEPFRPMLSKRIDAGNFKKEFPDDKLFYVENKFDGERFQIHMKNNQFKYFSRNGFDYTSYLGESYETGTFTSRLKNLFKSNVNTVILDGEMMLWDKRTRKFGSKGMSLDVKKLNTTGPFQPCFCIFDIILLNGEILTNKPLQERVAMLRNVFNSVKEGTILLSEIREVNSRQEIIDELNQSMNREEEGIVVKDPNSIYKYSDRNSGWCKMKLEYFQDVMNDLDLIVMGANYMSSTSDTLNSFVVGIRSDVAENGKPLYLALGRVSSGLTNDDLANLNKRFKTQGKKIEEFSSKNLLFGRDKPNYYIEPEFSVVFQIRATELIRSTDNSFKTSYTLRFPRVLLIRNDKPVDECLSLNELLEITKNNKSVIKLNKRSIDLEEILKTKVRIVKRKEILMPTIYDNRQVSDWLEGYTIHVLNGTEECDKEKVESLIKKAGGSVSYRINEKVDIILVGSDTPQIKELASKRNKFDIINTTWLFRVLEDGNLLGYEQEEVYCLGYSYKNCLSDELDIYGDSYTVETTVEKLKKTFAIITQMKEHSNQNNTVRLKKLSKNFENYVAYFDKYAIPNESDSERIYDFFLDELEFRYYNGTVCDKITDDVNLIVHSGDSERKKIIDSFIASISRSNNIEVVSKNFIYEGSA